MWGWEGFGRMKGWGGQAAAVYSYHGNLCLNSSKWEGNSTGMNSVINYNLRDFFPFVYQAGCHRFFFGTVIFCLLDKQHMKDTTPPCIGTNHTYACRFLCLFAIKCNN